MLEAGDDGCTEVKSRGIEGLERLRICGVRGAVKDISRAERWKASVNVNIGYRYGLGWHRHIAERLMVLSRVVGIRLRENQQA